MSVPNNICLDISSLYLLAGTFNENFIEDFKKLNIEKNCEVLTMCMGGVRSQMAAELLTKEDYNCSNISDGFLGNSKSAGWKNSGLPCK